MRLPLTRPAELRIHTALRNHQLRANTRPATNGPGDSDFIHTVSTFQWFLDSVLRVKIPRSLCGVLLVGEPGEPEPTTPCPACEALR